jgi:hypothetical protein
LRRFARTLCGGHWQLPSIFDYDNRFADYDYEKGRTTLAPRPAVILIEIRNRSLPQGKALEDENDGRDETLPASRCRPGKNGACASRQTGPHRDSPVVSIRRTRATGAPLRAKCGTIHLDSPFLPTPRSAANPIHDRTPKPRFGARVD